MSRSKILFGVIMGSFLAQMVFAQPATLLDSHYQLTTLAQYSDSTLGRVGGMTADSSGNIFVNYVGSGKILKIGPAGNVSNFGSVTSSAPAHMVWGTGTEYGEFLYVSDTFADKVYKFDVNGNRSLFTEVNHPDGIGLDRTGNYGGQLYIGTNIDTHIDSVSPAGTRTLFSNFTYNESTLTAAMAFDPGTRFGGQMFATGHSTAAPASAGVFSVDANGIATRFCSNLALASKVEFDQSGKFGDDLFALGMFTPGQPYFSIYRIGPNGVAADFFHNFGGSFTFSGEHMFIASFNGSTSTTTIYQVNAIPEPATILVLAAGALGLKRRLGKE